MKLPTWQVCKENVELGAATALERFIYEYEPMDTRNALCWRSEFEKALVCWAQKPEDKPVALVPDTDNQLLLTFEQEPE